MNPTKSISYVENGTPLTQYLTKEYSNTKLDTNFSDHIPIIYSIINNDQQKILIGTWNICMKGITIIDRTTNEPLRDNKNNIIYNHKFKNIEDETDEQYEIRLFNIAWAIYNIISTNNLSYMVLQELPMDSYYANYFNDLIKYYGLSILKPDGPKGSFSEFAFVYSSTNPFTKYRYCFNFNDKNKIINQFQSHIDSNIFSYIDMIKNGIFYDTFTNTIIISVHFKGVDLSDSDIVHDRKIQLFDIMNAYVSFFKNSEEFKDYNIIFIGDFNISLIPFENIESTTYNDPSNNIVIYTTPDNKGYSYIDNNSTMSKQNIDMCVLFNVSSTITQNDGIKEINVWINEWINNRYIESNYKAILYKSKVIGKVIGNVKEFSNLFKEDQNIQNIINNMEIMYTVGDVSCFIHSLFMSVSKNYRNLTDKYKTNLAQTFRTNFLSKMEDNYYLSQSDLPINQDLINKYKDNFNNLEFYLTREEIQLISNRFKLNIMFFVLSGDSTIPNHIFSIFVNNDVNNKDKFDWIFSYNTAGNHYSSISIKDNKFILDSSEGFNLYENIKQNESYGGKKNKFTRKKHILLKKYKKTLKKYKKTLKNKKNKNKK